MDTTLDDDAPDIVSPPETIAAPSDSAGDEIDLLLQEYDRANQPAPESSAGQETPVQGDALADLLRSPADQQRIEGLTGELDSLRSAELERKSRADFETFSRQLQDKCGPNVDDQFAKTNLLALAAERPELMTAWQNRHLTKEQLAAVDLEFRNLERLYPQVQRQPDGDPKKAQTLAWMQARGQQLGLALNSKQMLDRAWRDIEKRASEFKPIDADATADYAAVAQAVRDGAAPVGAEPPPNLGRMTDNELRAHTLKNYGF